MADSHSLLVTIRQGLKEILAASNARGLRQSSKWAAEMLHSLKSQTEVRSKCLQVHAHESTFEVVVDGGGHQTRKTPRGASSMNPPPPPPPLSSSSSLDYLSDCDYLMAKAVFDLGEYERAAFFTADYQTPEARFLHFYSRYLAIEKERIDRMVEPASVIVSSSLKVFIELRKSLEAKLAADKEQGSTSTGLSPGDQGASGDAYMHYLHGIILLKLGLNREAIDALLRSITLEPLCWASWHQLSQVIEDEAAFNEMLLPAHWLKGFFVAAVGVELQSSDDALLLLTDLLLTFPAAGYLLSQLAIVRYNLREVDEAIALFTAIRSADPFRLDAMDIYSNLLYVKEMQTELSTLAHLANKIDPYRVETCFCVANFYSLRGQHAKSVVYFSRALQLNPRHLSSWTLMGHEYVELKNTNAAIQAYRSAIKCNKRDYRAWYGLGQTYEILKMPAYCLYYYSAAHFLKPNDTRLITAIGQTYEKLGRHEDAANCYAKAGFGSLIRLAALYEHKTGEEHKAAAAYNEYVNGFEAKQAVYNLPPADLTTAYKYLAQYFYRHGKFQQSQVAAQMCMYFAETRDEAKELLNKLQNVLQVMDEDNQQEEQGSGEKVTSTAVAALATAVLQEEDEEEEEEDVEMDT